MTAALAAAFGSWFLATGEQAAAPPSPPPLAPKSVVTTPVAPTPAEPAAAPQAAAPAAADSAGEQDKAPVDSSDPKALAALQDKLAQAPEYAAFLAQLRSQYPGDYDAAVKAALAQGLQNHSDAADLFVARAVQVLRQTRGLMGARAGALALDHLFGEHEKVLRQLAAVDPSLCVDFLNGAPADRFVAFSSANRALMASEAQAGLDAIDDGSHKKIDREAPTPEDFNDLEKILLSRGMSRAAIDQLLDGKAPNPPLSDAEQCQNGLIYLESMKSLPDLQRLRLYALALEVMAHE